eukprot:CAMPEP_0116937634 /NCGR_PEP_ID=MMETSP0467-20121206/31619_1 /TAXON_ID=283647 /ORGANISM="Mesodinium pulex, Strain SPMC105" /LENGTH=80 /DNA_ID=CAMNT_0004619483 /DNA_START=1238 /DNA_END=1480 /DNA_ORIENTATION=+
MEGINFMGTKMLIEIDSFEKKFQENTRRVHDVLSAVDINSRLGVEKNLDTVYDEINELKKRVQNSIQLNEFNMTTNSRKK